MQLHKVLVTVLLLFIGYNIIEVLGRESVSNTAENPLITVEELKQLMKTTPVKLIDATYSGKPLPAALQRTNTYGQFDTLEKMLTEDDYKREHIPGAVPVSLDVALFHSQYKRFELYPPEIFEKYLRKLGINNGDRVVVYGREQFSGMLFAAHIWWLLKYYGVKNARVLNGGIEAWKRNGNPVTSEIAPVQTGNFTATVNRKYVITFEELEERNPRTGALIDHLNTENVFDSRPREQYSGAVKMNYNSPVELKGSHIEGAKNLPAVNLVNEKVLAEAGYIPGKPVITYCSVGNQGSLDLLALRSVGIDNIKLYQGGMTEMALRDPKRIS
ncbi:unnamed protein product [Enterobius vermicularis]|uniref:Sulfurtransferase n=1 Tax=Enterobius vermicularis TaxID=51028 RepID=A0A0N4V4B2_ENTVE|nr:unnamed protein product [Enterobius vermicularis]